MFVLGIALITLGITQDNPDFCMLGIANFILAKIIKDQKKEKRNKKK